METCVLTRAMRVEALSSFEMGMSRGEAEVGRG